MGVDLGLMKKVAEEQEVKNARRTGGSHIYWSPKLDKNRIRLMPPWTSEGDWRDSFFRELAMHWGVGSDEEKKHFPCPTKSKHGPEVTSKACPVCIQVERLRASGNPADAEFANELRARVRYYSNIVDMNDAVYTSKDVTEWHSNQQDKTRECPFTASDTKVQVYQYGPTVFDELLAVFAEQGIDITDFKSGHDIIITKEGQGRMTKYKTRPDFQATQFNFTGKPFLEVLPNLSTIVQFQPLTVMQAALDGVPSVAALPAAAKAPSLPPPQVQQQAVRQSLPPTTPRPAVAALPPIVESEAEAPGCFKDKQTCDPQDQECVGGSKGNESYDPCPFYKPCYEAKFGPLTKPRRAAKAAMSDNSIPASVEALEAEMKKMLQ